MKGNQYYLIGCASGIAGPHGHAGEGPLKIRDSKYLTVPAGASFTYHWQDMITSAEHSSMPKVEEVAATCKLLGEAVSRTIKNSHPFCVVAGDHSSAIGTWSGVYDALHTQGDFGLIWIDAHMDSHTPETSPSGNIHGMPLACLLGYGYPALTMLMHHQAKLKPENICLIGVRSFESGEAELLRRLNVRIYYMEEIAERGLQAVVEEALSYVKRHTIGFGLTVDIDSVDPHDAPGVDVPEAKGIRESDLCQALKNIVSDPLLIGCELVEFDPIHDKQDKTEKLMTQIIQIMAQGACDK